MKALVTGASGFVGNVLVRRLIADGHDVHLLLRSTHAPWRVVDVQDDCSCREVDLLDADAVLNAVDSIQPDNVFHLAAYGAYSHQSDARTILETNMFSALNLMHACKKVGCQSFIQAGSSSEYGLKDHAPLEDEWIDPNSYYAVSKAAATHLGRYTALHEDLPVITLRLYSVFGPYEEPTRLLPTLLVHALQHTLPPLVNAKTARDFIYVDDVVDAFLAAAEGAEKHKGAVFNVASGTETTLGDLVALVREKYSISAEPNWGSMESRSWDTTTWQGNASALQQQCGWAPKYTLESGVEEMMNWLKKDAKLLEYYRSCILK